MGVGSLKDVPVPGSDVRLERVSVSAEVLRVEAAACGPPWPGDGDSQVEAAAFAGEAGGGMQQLVAELLGLGIGEFAVQEQGAGPGGQVDRGQGQLQPGRVDMEVAGGEAAVAGGLAAADAVFDPGVCAVADLQILHGALSAWGVREEDLVAHALIEVEQGELGTGVRSLAADGDPVAVGISGQVDHAGQLGDLG